MPEYEFTTMYEPRNGTPVSVPTSEVQARLNEGFRSEKPEEDTVLKPTADLVRSDVSPSATLPAREMQAVEINSGTLKDLSVRLGLSTAQARLVKDRRTYQNIEDLIAKIPEVNNWANLAHLISFQVQEEPKEEEQLKEGVDIEIEAKIVEEKQGFAPVTTNEDTSVSGTSKAKKSG